MMFEANAPRAAQPRKTGAGDTGNRFRVEPPT